MYNTNLNVVLTLIRFLELIMFRCNEVNCLQIKHVKYINRIHSAVLLEKDEEFYINVILKRGKWLDRIQRNLLQIFRTMHKFKN